MTQSNIMSRRSLNKSTGSTSQGAFLTRQTKPKAIEVFEETCKAWREKSPAIFKNVKNGVFELKEITLTPG